MAEPLIATAERVTERLGRLFIEHTETIAEQESQQGKYNATIKGTTIKAPVYLTSVQAAEYLNVKQSLMEYWRWRKIGPVFIKVGSRVRYKLEALEAFLKITQQNNENINLKERVQV